MWNRAALPAGNQNSPCLSKYSTIARQQRVNLLARHVKARSVRQPKDPKAFKSMDDLREHLEQGEGGSNGVGFISGALNWISNTAFGEKGIKQPWWSPAGLYRMLTRGNAPVKWVVRRLSDPDVEDPNDPQYDLITRQHEVLGPLLLLSRSDLRRMVKRYPPVLNMAAEEVAMRVVAMKEVLPGCNTGLLIEDFPQLFLSGDAEQKRQQVVTAVAKLKEGLRGASVGDVIMVDPEILFMDLDHGLTELRELWDVDEQAMANSEPKHLALAVRTMCNTKKSAGNTAATIPKRYY